MSDPSSYHPSGPEPLAALVAFLGGSFLLTLAYCFYAFVHRVDAAVLVAVLAHGAFAFAAKFILPFTGVRHGHV